MAETTPRGVPDIDTGFFERVGNDLTRKDEQGRENTCLLINGDGRNLSMFADNSFDVLLCVIYTSLAGCSLGSLRY